MYVTNRKSEPGKRSRLATRLRAGQFGARIQAEARIFSLPQNVQTVSGVQTNFNSMGTVGFPHW